MDFLTKMKDRIQGKAPKGAKRSSKWKMVKEAYLKEHPECAICGSTAKIEVHHVIPFHLAPDLELDPTNFITLCENKKYGVNCHLLFGHLGNYKRTNLTIREDAIIWNMRITE